MKKTVKTVSIMLLAIMLIAILAGTVYAAGENGIQGALDNLKKPVYTEQSKIQGLGQKIVGVIQIVGVVIAVVVILVIGIKYIIGSAEEKAEYKKTMIPYVVGAILIFAGSTIVNVLYNTITALND